MTDWSRGNPWEITPVGRLLIDHPELEETIFLRQLLKYQIPSPLEKVGTQNFHVRPFRLLLRFLKRAYEEGLIGLTKHEIALYVINVLDERDEAAFERAFADIRAYRASYNALTGKVAKQELARERLVAVAHSVGLAPGSLFDYADSNGRYALMSGLLTLRGNKLTLADSRLPIIDALLDDGTALVADTNYLELFYNPALPLLPTDDKLFLDQEIAALERRFVEIATAVNEPATLPAPPVGKTLADLQAYEKRLRTKLQQVRELQFYRTQATPEALDEIQDLLEDISAGTGAFFGGGAYAPAFLEWAIWRLFLAMNELVGPISQTRGFNIDEDMNPTHHAKGGAADLTLTYKDFKLVCEMTLTSGSQQFAREGEPVTRHVFKVIKENTTIPVYGVFVAKQLDANTVDAFHNARYWASMKTNTATPVVALEIRQIIKLLECMKVQPISSADMRNFLDRVLQLQNVYTHGPAWYEAYSALYEHWLSERH